MRETFINLADVPTHVMAWGPWIEETFPSKEVVICITGNPGLVGYYSQFLATVHEQLGADVPVWTLGHAGHDEPPEHSTGPKVPPLVGNEQRYDLDGQLRHKVEFIVRYVPADVRIHLVGHSIGAWLAVELLKRPEIRERVAHGYLLFPTIERMAESPAGQIYVQGLQRTWWLLRPLLGLVNLLPTVLMAVLVSAYFCVTRIPLVYVGTTLKYLRASIMAQVVHLADDEMVRVRQLDEETLRRNSDRLTLYYGATDGWTPAHYCRELCERIPGIDASIDRRGIRHAFVLKSSVEMGRLLAEWIGERRGK